MWFHLNLFGPIWIHFDPSGSIGPYSTLSTWLLAETNFPVLKSIASRWSRGWRNEGDGDNLSGHLHCPSCPHISSHPGCQGGSCQKSRHSDWSYFLQENPCLIRPWIVLTFISLFFYLIQIVVFFYHPPSSYDIYGIFGIEMTTKHTNGIKDNDLSISFWVSIGFAMVCVAIGFYPLSVVSSFRFLDLKYILNQLCRRKTPRPVVSILF